MNIESKIFNLIVEHLDPSFVESILSNSPKDDLNIFDDFGYDSLSFIELIIKLESTFQIQFDEENLISDNFGSVLEITQATKSLINSMSGDESDYES